MIRKFKKDDITRVMEIWLKSNIETHSFIQEKYFFENYNMVKEILPYAEVYVYTLANDICGFVGISDGYIDGLFVDKSFRKRGIGKTLLEKCKEENDMLTLKVYIKNVDAVLFYKECGFKIVEEDIASDTQEREYTMRWNVDK